MKYRLLPLAAALALVRDKQDSQGRWSLEYDYAGKTWVDYELALPRLTPIRLKFGIAMGPDVAQRDRSDGG